MKKQVKKAVGTAAKVSVRKSAPVKTAKKAVKTEKAVSVKNVKKLSVTAAKKPAVKKALAAKASAAKKPAVKKAPAAKVSAAKKPAVKKAPVIKNTAVKQMPVKKQVPAVKAVVPEESILEEHDHPIRKRKLNKTEKKYFRELLEHARASFGEQIQVHVSEALSSRKDSAGERAGMATHMADLGSDNFRHDFELGLLTDEVDVLEMIDEALQRIDDSEYGVCLDCGAFIPKERLEAKPYARYCTKCKSKREQLEESRYHR